jgi:hypothetical protein
LNAQKKRDLVRDYAVFGRKVVWLEEGISDGGETARGHFSTSIKDVDEYLQRFEDLWGSYFSIDGGLARSPHEEARAILDAQTGGTGNESKQ